MNALDSHKQKILDRYEEGIGIQPFWTLHNYVYERWQEEKNDVTEMARQIMYSAEINGRPDPGRRDIENAFEKVYLEHPRKAVEALQLILSCPTETGYKEYVAEQKAAMIEGRPPRYSGLFANYGVPDEELH